MASGIVEQSSQEKESRKGGTVAAPGNNRSQLVQRLLDSSSSLPAFIHDLLTTQAVTVAGTEAAGFLIERQPPPTPQDGADGAAQPPGIGLRPIAHIRPDASSAETRQAAIAAFQDLIRPCIQQGRDGAIEIGAPGDGQSETQFCLVTLLRNEGEVVAASAVITRCMNVERARQRLMSMQLVAGYFELFTLRRNSEQARMVAQSHQHVLQLATSVATAEGFESAAMNLCNELATRAHATRVSLGWVKGHNIRVKAISHTEEFDKKQDLVVTLQKVMEEAMDQEAVVQFDPNGKSSDNVTRSAQALSRSQGGHTVLSLPLRRKAEVIGVVTLEFLPTQKVGPQVANGLSIAVDLLAPQLYDRYQNDRYLITKAGISAREGAKAVIGPRHMLAKLIAVAVIGAVAFCVLYKPMYKVSAPFQFVPTARTSVSAPYEGVMKQLAIVTADGKVLDPEDHADLLPGERRLKAGDWVKKGQVLCKMKTTELELKRNEALAQESRSLKEAAKYRDDNKPSEEAMSMEQAAASRAEAELLREQIDQGSVRAPDDGQVLKGDLEDKQGSPVKQGDVLFEVGRPEALTVELAVNERDIQDVKPGQKVFVATNSLPDDKFEATVDRVVPMGEAKEGGNVFKVYANLNAAPAATWRPGMAGEARVDVRPEPVWWIYSHRLIDFVKLKLWL